MNKLCTDCGNASSVNVFKNKVDTCLRRADNKNCWTLTPMASMST